MKYNKLFIIILLQTVFFSSCVEEFDPEIDSSYNKMLVVDGEINQGTGNLEISLSFSTAVDMPVYDAATSFDVNVTDDLGNIANLTHIGSGVYRCLNEDFEAAIGRKYKLILHNNENDKSYESSWETMPEPVPIENIYERLEYQEDENVDHTLEGFRFYLNTGNFNNDSTCFRWELTETYKYTAQYALYFIYNGTLEPTTAFDSLYTCYKTDIVEERFSRSTSDLASNSLIGYPLNFVSTETERLLHRYSLLVEQKVISKQAFKFWDDVAMITSSEASLFTTQPYQIQGNIKNINDENEIVLGYFEASAVSEKRIFVDKPLLLNFHNKEPDCTLETEEVLPILEGYSRMSWPLFCTAISVNGFLITAFPVNQSCVDCTKKGGKAVAPDFWVE